MKPIFVLLLIFLPLLTNATDFKKGYSKKGKASYYGKKFHGRLTANGEKFNMYALTAAHKTLPFNSLLRVTDVSTGKQIMVRVNDRGPFIKGRMLDLSKGAANQLDMLDRGVVEVSIEIVRLGTGEEEEEKREESVATNNEVKEPKKVSVKNKSVKGKTFDIWGTPIKASGYGIQIGSYTSKKQMVTMAKKAYARDLKELYIQQVWLKGKLHYRVLYLAEDEKARLSKALVRMRKMGYRQAFIRSHLSI